MRLGVSWIRLFPNRLAWYDFRVLCLAAGGVFVACELAGRGGGVVWSVTLVLLHCCVLQPHLASRAKQDMSNYMRQMEIDRGNRALMSRVSHLMNHKVSARATWWMLWVVVQCNALQE